MPKRYRNPLLVSVYNRRYRLRNPEKRKAVQSSYYQRNKDKLLEYAKNRKEQHNIDSQKSRRKNQETYRKHYAKNKDKYKESGWRSHLKRYGLSIEEYDALLQKQNGKCAICGNGNSNGSRLHLDHDHKTLMVRGFLCKPCNHGLGFFRDNPAFLVNAIEYLCRK